MTTKSQLMPGQVTEIAISKLLADPDQPRKTFDKTALDQLAGSIGKSGIRVPLLVRPGLRGKWIIVDGERRYRAAKLAKLKTLPALLDGAGAGDGDLRAAQLAVNELREQLRPMERARTLANLRREHYKTDNELAAFLDAQGLPPMKPKEIREAVALVDLPAWLQDMIDAGQVEASSAAMVSKATPWPEVMKEVEGDLKQRVQWSGKATHNDVLYILRDGFRAHGAPLGHTNEWNDGRPGCVYFNPKTAGKKLPDVVNIGGEKYCMDVEAFEKLNKEAQEAGLGPGGRKRIGEKPPALAAENGVEQKAEKRARTLGQKARDYLHAYLVERIVAFMSGDVDDEPDRPGHKAPNQIDITDELLAWRGLAQPGAWSTGEPNYKSRDRIDEAAYAAGAKCLEDFFAADGNKIEALKLTAAVEVARDLAWRDTQVVCHQLWGTSIEKVWSMDEAFLKLFRKAELVHLAETHGLEPPEGKAWDKLKLAEQRAEILTRKGMGTIGKPQILQDLYADVADPHVPYSQRGDDYYDDLADEEGCEHGVPFEEICEACEEEEAADE